MNSCNITPTPDSWILRRARVAGDVGDALADAATHDDVTMRRVTGSVVDVDVDALAAVELAATPGWITGEPPLDQGIEVTMPNLPHELPLPEVAPKPFRCRVEVVGPDTVRLTVGPADARVFRESPEWLGIVTRPTVGQTDAVIEVRDDDVVVATSAMHVTIGLAPFRIEFARTIPGERDRTLLRTAERLRQVAGFPMAPPLRYYEPADGSQPHTVLNLELGTDEEILGFGEQFSRVVKNGQHLLLRCEDALGTGTGLAYKPAPVWHSTLGYTGFVNTGAQVAVDVGHTRPSVLSLDVPDQAIDLYVFADPAMSERLATYTTLTGRAERPPLWAFGYWMGRCRYHNRDEVLAVADAMHTNDVPIDVLHTDPDWLIVDRLNTDFIWNAERFGQLDRFVDDLASRQIRLSIWEVPYLDPTSPRYAEAEAAGYLARTTAGELAELQGTPTPDGRPRGLLDTTNPDALAWWQELHGPFIDAGVAVFKTDFGEGCPDDIAAVDGTPPNHVHNLYPLRYNGAVSDAVRARAGRAPLVWGRSGWAGSHRYPGQWGGDAESTVAGMQATLRAGLSHALCNPGFWSHDIGGFFGPELTPGLYVRWTQFGALSPLMRAHGLRPREPWEFGDAALEICRDWIRLRYSLLPYLWQVAGDVARHGLPMMRPLVLAFPDDRVAPHIDDQFMLGSDLLVAPILDDEMRTVARDVYLPAGRWFEFATDTTHPGATPGTTHAGTSHPEITHPGVCHRGPGFVRVEASISQMPVFVRDGARIPRVDVDASVRCAEDVIDRPWTLHDYGDTADATWVLDGFDGAPVTPSALVLHG